jgi:hypothetical protein
MATMAAGLVAAINQRCLIVLDAYFAVGPVFDILKQVVDANGRRLVHIVTRAKSNVVGYDDPPKKTGLRGRPRIYGVKHHLITLFETRSDAFEKSSH